MSDTSTTTKINCHIHAENPLDPQEVQATHRYNRDGEMKYVCKRHGEWVAQRYGVIVEPIPYDSSISTKNTKVNKSVNDGVIVQEKQR